MNGASLELKHYAPAHADCDIAVHFPDADIIHVGDTWCNGFYPFIDYSTGGSINGMIRATEVNLARVANKTAVIPGHGPADDEAQLTEFRDMLVGVCDKVAALKRQGRSVAEVVATKLTAATDAKWGGFLIPPGPFVELVYQGVSCGALFWCERASDCGTGTAPIGPEFRSRRNGAFSSAGSRAQEYC